MRPRYLVVLAGMATALAVVAWLAATQLGGVSTRARPTAPERIAARIARRWAVPPGARAAQNPVPFSPGVWSDARAHFADHCASCHANDGSGRTEIGENLYPKAPDMRLADTQRLSDGEIYWIIENGVRLTGMPAWGDGSGTDIDTWKLVHFVRHLNELTEEHLKEMADLNPKTPAEFEEERQDRLFLEGKDPDATTTAPPHHQH